MCMTKREKIIRIHKILYAKEDFDNVERPDCTLDVFQKSISNCTEVRLSI